MTVRHDSIRFFLFFFVFAKWDSAVCFAQKVDVVDPLSLSLSLLSGLLGLVGRSRISRIIYDNAAKS